MKPLEHPLLADENISPDVIQGLRRRGRNVASVSESGLAGQGDVAILRFAFAQSRVVLTHDADFAKLAIRGGEPFHGIVYLRPGHIRAEFVLEMLDALDGSVADAIPPFVLVADRRANAVKVRLRRGAS